MRHVYSLKRGRCNETAAGRRRRGEWIPKMRGGSMNDKRKKEAREQAERRTDRHVDKTLPYPGPSQSTGRLCVVSDGRSYLFACRTWDIESAILYLYSLGFFPSFFPLLLPPQRSPFFLSHPFPMPFFPFIYPPCVYPPLVSPSLSQSRSDHPPPPPSLRPPVSAGTGHGDPGSHTTEDRIDLKLQLSRTRVRSGRFW